MSLITREEAWGLIIGTLVVMLVVWATLPSEYDRVVSKKCYKACKEMLDKEGHEFGIFSEFSDTSYSSMLSECYEECVRETDENSN